MLNASFFWTASVAGAGTAVAGVAISWGAYQHWDDTSLHVGPALGMFGGVALVLLGVAIAAVSALAAAIKEEYERRDRNEKGA